jgi:putative tryptophan/tyrosine transport system substrate-binding protein
MAMTRQIRWLLATLVFAHLQLAAAQQPTKIPRVGFLPSEGDASNPGTQINAFQQGLRDLGYIEGKNILLEYRHGAGQAERIPSLVADLVQT